MAYNAILNLLVLTLRLIIENIFDLVIVLQVLDSDLALFVVHLLVVSLGIRMSQALVLLINQRLLV